MIQSGAGVCQVLDRSYSASTVQPLSPTPEIGIPWFLRRCHAVARQLGANRVFVGRANNRGSSALMRILMRAAG
jgi:hypothetical protein